MPGSNRDNLIAIGVAVLLALFASAWIYNDANQLEQLYQHRAEQNAKAYRDTARIHAQRACLGMSSAKLSECVHEQYHAARERERNEYDLQAQLVTSVWTRAMGLSALIAMSVGILGVGLVYMTFNATRQTNEIAWKEAERNAKEADRARKHIIQTERAILQVDTADIRIITDAKWITLSLTVKNEGRSNAWGLQVYTAQRRSRLFPAAFTGHIPWTGIVKPGTKSSVPAVRIRAPAHYPIWVFGYLVYTTAHESTFKTFFCWRLDGEPKDDGYGGMLNAPKDARGEVDLPPNT